jgi:hypothetical protein
MARLPRFLAIALMLAACGPSVGADGELHVGMTPAEVEGRLFLGTVEVEGVGPIKLVARRRGDRVSIYANSVDGATLGRAEVELTETETQVPVRTLDGLEPITIVWGSD